MKKYFLHNGQQQYGPYSLEELKSMNIAPETMAWYDGLPQWMRADQIEELKSLFGNAVPPPFTATPPPAFQAPPVAPVAQPLAQGETIGIFTKLQPGETLEVENPSVSTIHFEQGSFFKSYDTCIGKVYLTNKRLLILKLIVLEAKNMKIESVEQFGSAMGQWFDVSLEYVTSVSTPKQGFFRGLLKSLIGEKKEGLELHYESPLEVEKKSLFGSKKVKETFVLVFTIDNKNLWNMKIQTNVARARPMGTMQ